MSSSQRRTLASTSTERLQLRPPVAGDLAILGALQADPAANRFCACWAPATPEAVQALLDGWMQHWQTHGFGIWAISRRDPPQSLIGFGGLGYRSVGDQAGLYLYYRLLPSAWGQGYASEMAQRALALAFEQYQVPAVLAAVLPSNAPTRKTLQALGLRIKGTVSDRPGDEACLLYEVTADAWAGQPHPEPAVIPFAA